MSRRGRDKNYRGGQSESDQMNPDSVLEYGTFVHKCENVFLFKVLDITRVPKFSSPVFLKNKTPFGKVDEVLGPVNESYITVVPLPAFSSGFQKGDSCYIAPDKLLMVQRFLEEPAPRSGGGRGGRGGYRGGAQGNSGRGRGGFKQNRGSWGTPRGKSVAGRQSTRGNDNGRRGGTNGRRGENFGGRGRGFQRGRQ